MRIFIERLILIQYDDVMKLNKKEIWFPIILILAVFVAYSNIYNFEFLYDDEFLIIKNRFLTSFEYLGSIFTTSSTGGAGYVDSFYRPLQILFYLIIEQLFGQETWAHHFLNISLHAVNTVLVYTLAKKMKLQPITAVLCAAIWGLHPLHTEAVTYMSATADPLHTLFILSGLIVAVPTFSTRRLAYAMGFFILALLSKESAIVFPALLFTMVYFFSKKHRHWKSYLPTLPFWIMSGIYFVLRMTLLNFNNDLSMYKQSNIYSENILYRLYTFLATLPSYAELIFWPHGLHIDRQFPVFTSFLLMPVILGTLLTLCAAAASYKWRWFAWATLWFVASYVPQSGVLIPVNSMFLEHWMYLPLIGFVLCLGAGLEKLRKPQKLWQALAVVVALTLGFLTFQQNWMWENPTTLYSRILTFNPSADRVRHNLAMAYSDRGDLDLALEQYSIVLKTTPTYHQTYHNMARIYLQKGDWEKAESHFLKAISIKPDFFPSYASLAELYYKKGDMQKAEEYKKKFEQLKR